MLSEELGALDRARLSLANGDTRRALDELDGYDRRFPGGRLQLEAEVMRIDAFAKVGRKDLARQHADAFLRRHPTSVLATRVRAHLAD
jgi:outer membrane protein assembly factor BamD (BamD/ComL family)